MAKGMTTPGPPHGTPARGQPSSASKSKRPLIWIAALSLAPFLASFAAYYWLRPASQMNYGTLVAQHPLPAVSLHALSGEAIAGDPLRG
jgi:hypothetical protein